MVAILLSCYNGEKYIKAQIDSIIQQDYVDWNLYIRDDGSSDNTILIVEDYVKDYPNKIYFIKDDKGNLGFAKSFLTLLSVVESDFYMYCDQDDVWFKNKVSTLLNIAMRESPVEESICVFCNGEITNSELLPQNAYMYDSFKCNMSLALNNLTYALAYDWGCYGCTMLFNNTVRKLIFPKNDFLLSHYALRRFYHDTLIALSCIGTGKCLYYDKSLMYYRQHENNTFGFESIHYINSKYSYLKIGFKWRQVLERNYLCYKTIPIKVPIFKVFIAKFLRIIRSK